MFQTREAKFANLLHGSICLFAMFKLNITYSLYLLMANTLFAEYVKIDFKSVGFFLICHMVWDNQLYTMYGSLKSLWKICNANLLSVYYVTYSAHTNWKIFIFRRNIIFNIYFMLTGSELAVSLKLHLFKLCNLLWQRNWAECVFVIEGTFSITA